MSFSYKSDLRDRAKLESQVVDKDHVGEASNAAVEGLYGTKGFYFQVCATAEYNYDNIYVCIDA
jgi:hypothetical protein